MKRQNPPSHFQYIHSIYPSVEHELSFHLSLSFFHILQFTHSPVWVERGEEWHWDTGGQRQTGINWTGWSIGDIQGRRRLKSGLIELGFSARPLPRILMWRSVTSVYLCYSSTVHQSQRTDHRWGGHGRRHSCGYGGHSWWYGRAEGYRLQAATEEGAG